MHHIIHKWKIESMLFYFMHLKLLLVKVRQLLNVQDLFEFYPCLNHNDRFKKIIVVPCVYCERCMYYACKSIRNFLKT